jgi:hypothetical protein
MLERIFICRFVERRFADMHHGKQGNLGGRCRAYESQAGRTCGVRDVELDNV